MCNMGFVHILGWSPHTSLQEYLYKVHIATSLPIITEKVQTIVTPHTKLWRLQKVEHLKY